MYVGYPERTGCRVSIATANSAANITITSVDEETTIRLEPGKTFTHTLDITYQTDNGTEDKGVLITADTVLHIVLELLDLYHQPVRNIDSTQILPLPHSLKQYKYYLVLQHLSSSMQCRDSTHTQFYTIAASEPTLVSIHNEREVEVTMDLDPHQTYTYVITGSNLDVDPTGKLVISTEGVSVISGTLCDNRIVSRSYFTHIQPSMQRQLSRTYYVAPQILNYGYDLRIIAAENNTWVRVDSNRYLIEEGQFIHHSFPFGDTMCVIQCDGGCSAYIVPNMFHDVVGTVLLGIIPTSDFYTSAYLITPDYNVDEVRHYVSLVLEGCHPYDDITLDGESHAGWAWRYSGGFSHLWMMISKGSHWLQSTEGRQFAAYVYGNSGNFSTNKKVLEFDGVYGHSIWSGE